MSSASMTRRLLPALMLGLALAAPHGAWAQLAPAATTDLYGPPPGGGLPGKETDFGRMFPKLGAFQPPETLLATLAELMRDPAPGAAEGNNPDLKGAGFTFWGQFLDHDITLMVEPLGSADKNLKGLLNNRTARLDLDSVYGGGIQGSPQLYDAKGRFKFATPNGFEDFQRDPVTGEAVVPENRNDENLIIAQLHIAFQKFHIYYIDQGLSFNGMQSMVAWQWQSIALPALL